jgi:hypothetical protein
MITSDTRELALGELDQVTGGNASSPGGAGPAPAAAFVIATTAFLGLMFGLGVVIGHVIKGDE